MIIIGIRCQYCNRFKPPHDILDQPGGVRICLDCEHRHQQALESLSTGEFHGECSECGKTAEQLGGVDVRMAVHYEAGKYRLMCMACDKKYVPKRKELYGPTEFGRTLGL